MGTEGARNIKWIDGLRGIASASVLGAHLARGWDYDLYLPRDQDMAGVRFLQLPFIRLAIQGRLGVCIFALLTGFVCALKPLKQIRAGTPAAALNTVARSCARRPPRLMLPAAFAMIIAWTVAQLGGFTVANRSDSSWMRDSSPELEPTFRLELRRLWDNFRFVWTTGRMDYDDHQWAMLPLLKGSIMVFVTLVGTVYMKFRSRMFVFAAIWFYFWQDNRPDTETFGSQFFWGMILCDLTLHIPFQELMNKYPYQRNVCSVLLIIGGLYIASFPSHNPEWAGWSRGLLSLEWWIFPEGTALPKRYTAAGVEMLSLGIVLSPTVKEILSSKFFLWLGKNSFAVYLVHGTLLRTILVWMIYGIVGHHPGQPWVDMKNEEGEFVEPPGGWLPRCGRVSMAVSIIIWLVLVYTCAHYWTNYVDPCCAKLTQRLEKWFFEDTADRAEKPNGRLPK